MTVAVRSEHPVKDRLLSPAQRAFWEENGYVIIPDAVPQESLDAVIEAIWEFLQVDRDDLETWYQAPVSPRRHAGDVSPPVPLGQSPARQNLPGICRCVAAGRVGGSASTAPT